MGGPIAQLLWQRHPELVDGPACCARRAARSTARHASGRCSRCSSGACDRPPPGCSAEPSSPCRTAGVTGCRPRRDAPATTPHDWLAVLDAGRAIGRFDSRRVAPEVDVPTSVVVTTRDHVVPPRASSSSPPPSRRHGRTPSTATTPSASPTPKRSCRDCCGRRRRCVDRVDATDARPRTMGGCTSRRRSTTPTRVLLTLAASDGRRSAIDAPPGRACRCGSSRTRSSSAPRRAGDLAARRRRGDRLAKPASRRSPTSSAPSRARPRSTAATRRSARRGRRRRAVRRCGSRCERRCVPCSRR